MLILLVTNFWMNLKIVGFIFNLYREEKLKMIKLNEVQSVKFSKANIGGYRPEEVDDFISEIEKAFEFFEDKCNKNEEVIKSLKNELKNYKEDEVYIKDVLVSAKKTADAEIKEARYKADCIINEAVEKSKDIVKQKELQIEDQEKVLNKMRSEVIDFKTRLLNEYKSHLKMIGTIERDYTKKDLKIEEKENQKNDAVSNKETRYDSKKDKTIGDEIKEKFAKLGGIKFGENYDIKADEDSPIKLFN